MYKSFKKFYIIATNDYIGKQDFYSSYGLNGLFALYLIYS